MPANPVRAARGVEELRTVTRIVGMGAEDCLVVDTFGFNFFGLVLCLAREKRWKRKPRPGVALCRAAA
jgi:hypothetical protein